MESPLLGEGWFHYNVSLSLTRIISGSPIVALIEDGAVPVFSFFILMRGFPFLPSALALAGAPSPLFFVLGKTIFPS